MMYTEKNNGDVDKRDTGYDYLRIISTIAVILIHVNWRYFSNVYLVHSRDGIWITESLINIITRFSVPCFVMISGAFILKNERNADFKYFYKKAFLNVVLPAMLAEFILVMVFVIKSFAGSDSNEKIINILKQVAVGGFENFWYIYMLVGIYVLVPVVLRIKKMLSYKEWIVFAVFLLCYGVFSQSLTTHIVAYDNGIVMSYLGYFLIGNIIYEKKNKRSNMLIDILLCIIGIAICFFARIFISDFYTKGVYKVFFSPGVVLMSFGMFSLFGKLEKVKSNRWSTGLRKKCFGIYMFHSSLLKLVGGYIDGIGLELELAKILIITVITFCVSLVCSICFDYMYAKIKKRTIVLLEKI